MRTSLFPVLFRPLAYAAALFLALTNARACEMPPPAAAGALYACPMRDGAAPAFCPLEHTEVRAEVSGDIARVTVTQRFHNQLSVPIEATYTFPLSEKGAVDRMHFKIGDRIVIGTVKEKEEARQAYEQAKSQGKTAALLDQQRPNIFTQSVANVQPGETIEVTISYVEYLKHEADNFEFAFPMTVGTRYIPGNALPNGNGTTQVPDATNIAPSLTPEGTRAGHDISLEVLLDAGMPLGDVKSELHRVHIERPSDSRALVRLDNDHEVPNRDFILKYNVSGDGIRQGVLTHHDDKGGFFTLWLQPPADAAPRDCVAKELIFVIDCSGSMMGFPIAKAKDTMAACIKDLSPADTFNLISFSGGTGFCFQNTVAATDDNKRQALAYLEQLQGGGGTEMMSAVQAALAPPFAKDRLRTICFMTDGFIGNDMAILGAIQRGTPYARVFSFGIGNSVNRFLIEGMAREGRGASEIVTLESNGNDAAKRFRDRIKRPVLTNIIVTVDGLDVCPPLDKLPDLFAGQPLRITGRYDHIGPTTITVRGETATGAFERTIDVSFPNDAPEHDSLASLWARQRVDTLMAADWQGIQEGRPRPEIKQQIIDLGTHYSLVTQYTSFIAIEENRRSANGQPLAVNVPVDLPDGVSYEGIGGTPIVRQQLQSLGYLGGAGMNKSSRAIPAAPAPALMSAPKPEPVRREAKPAEKAMSVAPRPVEAPAGEAAATKEMDKKSKDESANEKRDDTAANAKLDPALRGLAAKLVNGAFSGNGLHVMNGMVEVAVYLRDINDATLAALRGLGLEVRSQSRASNKVLVRTRVDALEKAAALDAVLRIAPPNA